jgi:hypothetical protein
MLRCLFQNTPIRELSREFKLISHLPVLSYKKDGDQYVDMEKPFAFTNRIEHMHSISNVNSSVLPKKSYECADDICMIALTLEHNMDACAWGINNTLREATLEAARMPEAEHCRYIRIEAPLHNGAATVVLENTTERANYLQAVLIISLA